MINLVRCRNQQDQQNQIQSRDQPYQATPPARPEPPVTLTVGADPHFPEPPTSSRSSQIFGNVTNNNAETSRLKIT